MPSLSENLSPLWDSAPTSTPTHTARGGHDAGLLLLRLAVGAIFAVHGAQKLFGWFGGRGLDGTERFFTDSGYPYGRILAAVTGGAEVAGGIALVLGLLTPVAGAALIAIAVNALALKWHGGFAATKGVEYEGVLLAAAVALTLAGPGRCAADRLLPGLRNHRLAHGVTALFLGLVVAAGLLVVRSRM